MLAGEDNQMLRHQVAGGEHLDFQQAWPVMGLLGEEMRQAAHFIDACVYLVHQLHDLQRSCIENHPK